MQIRDIHVLGAGLLHHALVEVEMTDGTIGIGLAEGHGPAMRALLQDGSRHLRGCLLGQQCSPDAAGIAALWRHMTAFWGDQGGPIVNAMGAVDMALWDAAGKSQGLALHQMLGGAVRPRVMAYASCTAYRFIHSTWSVVQKPADDMVAELGEYVQQGFKAIKIGWGNSFTPQDQQMLADMRQAIGSETRLMLDFGMPAHWAEDWSLDQALAVLRICQVHGVYFLEEPFAPHDLAGHAALVGRTPVKIATGEMLATVREFEPFIAGRALDIVQPDASRIGITQLVDVARQAEAAGLLCVPHSPWSAPATAAHLHVLATLRGEGMVEYPAPHLTVDEGEVCIRRSAVQPVDSTY